MSAAEDLARELGTTPNDAIVRLAEDGAATAERRRQVQRLADERRAAVSRGLEADAEAPFPPPERLRAAMLSGRREP